MAKLIINPTSSSRREIALARTLVSIGRDPSNDVVLPDAMVSRRHAVIEYRGSQYFLRDCNSSNGSLVNGDRVSERNLRDGDLVAIGTARLLFREELELEDAGAKVVPHPSAPRQVCPSCQADYRKGDMFCRQCGTSLAPSTPARVVCTSCGTAVLLPARFCNACGHALKDAGRAGEDGPDPAKPRPAADGGGDGPAPPGPPAASEGDARADAGVPEPAAASPEPPDAGAEPVPPGPVPPAAPAAPASSPADVADAPRVPRALSESASSRSSPLAQIVRPAAPPAIRATPAAVAAPLVGPRPAPAIVRGRPEAARRPEPRAAAPSSVVAAGFGVRALAALADALLVGAGQLLLVSPVLYYWYAHWWSNPPATAADVAFWPILVSMILVPVVLALGAVYYVYYWGVQGATPGKRLLGLVVQAEDGEEPIGLSRAAIRVLGYLLSGLILGIGFLMIAFGGAGLHDRLAGTRVVRRERG
jgi:uncharacterized RDD family membrane protein YckC